MFDEDVQVPLVSIVVPVYNSGDRLIPCVRSILGQDHTRIEVILVDDGSTDGSGQLCDELAATDARVIVLHQENRGIAAAQNAGLSRVTGSYLTFCDNDDLMRPQLVSRLLKILREADADMSMCRWLSVGASAADAELAAKARSRPGVVEVFDRPALWYQSVFSLTMRRATGRELRYFSEANWGKLYRTELFDGIRFPEGRYAQDVAVAMDLYTRMRRVASCADELYIWIQHGQSVSHRERRTAYFHDIVHAHGHSFDLAMQAGITPARAYGGMMTLDQERRSIRSAADRAVYDSDVREVRSRVGRLRLTQRIACWTLHRIRRLEVLVYRATVHRRR
ncbi:glycosyltransferase family 2 protein [Microbacterium aurum]